MKKTKIVSTLGPASNDIETITALAKAGANVFRFNFSHGDHPEHLARMKMVRQVEKDTGLLLGIDLDTKGAEIRTTEQEGGKFTINTGDMIRVSMDATKKGNKDMIHVTYDGFVIGSKKCVNAHVVEIRLPAITEKDTDDITFGLKFGINFITASFARKAQDILDIRKLCEEAGADYVKIFPKIESQEGINNADEILQVSDGLMVARGDMGVEIPFMEVPFVQKSLIRKANALKTHVQLVPKFQTLLTLFLMVLTQLCFQVNQQTVFTQLRLLRLWLKLTNVLKSKCLSVTL